MRTKEIDLAKEIDEMNAVEYLVETNEGTYGPGGASRPHRTGDPRFNNYRIYETVGGAVEHIGCDPAIAPGYARKMNRDNLAADRKRLAQLRREARRQ